MTREPLTFTSRFKNNALVIIDALGDTDLQTAIHLRDAIDDATSVSRPTYCNYFKVRSSAELFTILDDLTDRSKAGLLPILHIEAHGDKERGLEISTTGEMVHWDSLLPSLQAINKASRNNLGVVLAACFGLYAIKPLNIEEPCPFYFLIGPDEPVSAGDIDDMMKHFYLELGRTNSLDKAMKKVDTQFKQFHAEKFFYITFAKYMKRACIGTGAQRRVEHLVTMAAEGGAISNRASLRVIRKNARTFVRSQEHVFNRRAALFLHGRRSVSFVELQSFVRGDS